MGEPRIYGIVATVPSKFGGRCMDCGTPIRKGELTHKVGTSGDSTRSRQGPGYWVGDCCYDKYDKVS